VYNTGSVVYCSSVRSKIRGYLLDLLNVKEKEERRGKNEDKEEN
jgi:hypothetical protein